MNELTKYTQVSWVMEPPVLDKRDVAVTKHIFAGLEVLESSDVTILESIRALAQQTSGDFLDKQHVNNKIKIAQIQVHKFLLFLFNFRMC